MHIFLYTRSLVTSTVLGALLATTGCATNPASSAPATSTEPTASPTSSSPAPDDPQYRQPVRPRRADLDALRQGVLAKLLATDMAAAWSESPDEVAILLAPFKDETVLNLHIQVDSMRSWLETALVNTPNTAVLSPDGAELMQLFRDSDLPTPLSDSPPQFVKLLNQSHTIHGSLSASEVDADQRNFTLTLRVLKAGHEDPLAVVSESVTVTRPNSQATE